eukprot:scaffold27122_cov23-Cyclotella_meneghiniana.AAC.1
MIVLRPVYKQVSSTNHVSMSYEQVQQQPWDGRNRPWGRYKPTSSTVMVSGCRDGANQKFLTSSSLRGIQYPVPAQIAYCTHPGCTMSLVCIGSPLGKAISYLWNTEAGTKVGRRLLYY